MNTKITISWDVPECNNCGVQGDLIIDMSDSDIRHVWCKECGTRLDPRSEREST